MAAQTEATRRTAAPAGVTPGLLIAAIASCAAAAHATIAIDTWQTTGYVRAALAQGAIYLGCVWLVLRGRTRATDLAVILVAALVLRGFAALPTPNLSTDAFRYVWDGRVQAAGFSPYLHVPAAPVLEHLRDRAIYPHVNQKETAVTIYPPAAQLLFRGAHALADGMAGIRLVMTALDLATVGLVLAILSLLGQPRERVLIYAWHPLPIWEFTCQAHIDAAATAAIAAGLLAAVAKRQSLTGAVFAVAALVKYFPVVLLPALWRRWDWRLPLALAGVSALLYLPYVTDAGWRVLGFLGRHLDNEGYAAGWGFHPVWLLRDFSLGDLSGTTYTAAALLVLGALAADSLLRRPASELRFDRLLMLGAAFVWLTSPHYPWYFAFLAALLPFAPRWPVLVMSVLSVMLYLPRPPGGITWTGIYLAVYWLPVLLLLMEVAVRRWRGQADQLSASLSRR